MAKEPNSNSGMKNRKQMDRRDFLMNGAKFVIPMLAVMGLKINGSDRDLTPLSSACNGTCYGSCEATCSGCTGNCSGSCSGTCYGTCGGTCSGTSG